MSHRDCVALVRLESLEGRSLLSTVLPNVDISRLPGNEAEADITINRADPNQIFAVSKVTPEVGLMAAYSNDAGQTWTSRIIADGTDGLPVAGSDPVAAFDDSGNLFYAYLTSKNRIQVLQSRDGGLSFIPIQSFGGGVDQPTIVAANGTVWISYYASGSMMAAGASIAADGTVGPWLTQKAPGSKSANFGDIAIGPNGQVLMTYQRPTNGEGPAQIYVNLDPDGLGPQPFGPAVFVTSTNVGGFDALPAQFSRTVDAEANLAYDRSNGLFRGRVYMSYTDEMPDESNDMDVLVRYSDDNGRTWSAPIRVNDDTGTNSQFLPNLAVDQTTGQLAVAWHDARNDLGVMGQGSTNNIPNDDTQLWAAVGIPSASGIVFQTNIQISAGTSNADLANNRVQYGDYIGLDFHAGAMYPIWADNSNSAGTNPEGTLTTFDVYTARVEVGGTSGNDGPTKPGGGKPRTGTNSLFASDLALLA